MPFALPRRRVFADDAVVAHPDALADGQQADSVSVLFRPGDVRHVVASPDRAAHQLGFVARVDPLDGFTDFATAPLR